MRVNFTGNKKSAEKRILVVICVILLSVNRLGYKNRNFFGIDPPMLGSQIIL